MSSDRRARWVLVCLVLDSIVPSRTTAEEPVVTPLKQFEAGKNGFVTAAAINRDGSLVAVATRPGRVRVWGTAGVVLWRYFNPPPDVAASAADIAFDPGGKKVLVAGPWYQTLSAGRFGTWRGGQVRMWNLETGEEVFRFANPQAIVRARISSDEKNLLMLTTRGDLLVKDLTRAGHAEVEPTVTLSPPRAEGRDDPRAVESSGITAAGDYAVARVRENGLNTSIFGYNLIDGSVSGLPTGGPEPPLVVSATGDGKYIITSPVSLRPTLGVYDAPACRLVGRYELAQDGAVDRIFCDDADVISVSLRDGRLYDFNIKEKSSHLLYDARGRTILAVRRLRFTKWLVLLLDGQPGEADPPNTPGAEPLVPCVVRLKL